MASRAAWIFAVAIAAVAMMGCPPADTPSPSKEAPSSSQAEPQKPERPDGVVGYYVLDDPMFYSAQDMTSVSPGQIFYLGIEENRWMMRNMLSGFGGTWAEEAGSAILTINVGPTGKTDGKEEMTVTRTASGLTLSPIESSDRSMPFTYLAPAAPDGFGYDEFLDSEK